MDKFTAVYENAFSKEFCETVMAKMDIAIKQGFGASRKETGCHSKLMQDDIQLHYPARLMSNHMFSDEDHIIFNNTFWGNCFQPYADEFDILHREEVFIYGNKLQRIDVGQGYHAWHHETGPKSFSARVLAYIVYLNDVEEGGETEFLYQQFRLKPKQGTLVLFPAGFTHTHRGNPPLSNCKYIMTGWVEY